MASVDDIGRAAAGRATLPALLVAAGLLVAVSPAAAEETVELDIGGNTALADYEALEGDPKGPVALFLHGTFASKDQETADAMQAALTDLDLPSLAVSLTFGQDRREGSLECDLTHAHRHEDAIAELDAWIDWLKERGAEQIVLIGHSRGGAQTALYLAGEPDEAVKGAVLMAPATDSGDATASYKSRYDADLGQLLEKAGAAPPDEVMEVPGFVYCPDAKVTAASFLSYYGPDVRRDGPAILADGVDVPVLVIAAGADEVVTDLPERMPAVADGEKVRFEVVEDADHRFLDFYALDAADLVAEFMAEIADGN